MLYTRTTVRRLNKSNADDSGIGIILQSRQSIRRLNDSVLGLSFLLVPRGLYGAWVKYALEHWRDVIE